MRYIALLLVALLAVPIYNVASVASTYSSSGSASIHVYSDGSIDGLIRIPWTGENVTMNLIAKIQGEKTTISGVIEGPIDKDTSVNIVLTLHGENTTIRGMGRIGISTLNGSLDILVQDISFDISVGSISLSVEITATGAYSDVLNITKEDIEFMLYMMGLKPMTLDMIHIEDNKMVIILGTEPIFNFSRTSVYRLDKLVVSGSSMDGTLRIGVTGTIYGNFLLFLSDLQKIGLKIGGVPIGTDCLLGLKPVESTTGYLKYSGGILEVKTPRVTSNIPVERLFQRVASCLSEFGNVLVNVTAEPPYRVSGMGTLQDILNGKVTLFYPGSEYTETFNITSPPAVTLPTGEGRSRIGSFIVFAALVIPILLVLALYLTRIHRSLY